MDPVELGEVLFTQETFDGNGRVCATCHILENFGTMSPEHIQARWEEDPDDPLFRSIDSDDGIGDEYTRLLEHATVRVPITLGVHQESGLSVRRCDAPADTIVWLNRGNPSVFNIAREQHLMVDGRDGSSLPTQARNAVNTHAQPGREPTPEELEALAAFQRTLFSSEAVRRFVEHGEELSLPEPRTEQEARGREFFEADRQCGVCHAGPLLNETSVAHPDGPGQVFETAVVGSNPDNPNPKHFWCWVDPATDQIALGPNGNTLVNYMPTSDPGIGLLMAEFPILNGEQEVELTPGVEVMMGIQSFFKTPTLWGSPQTAPYFHDNSAKDLAEVMDHYNFTFSTLPEGLFDIGCEYQDPECLSPQDIEDIIAFMQLLSFDTVEEQLAAVDAGGGGGAGSH
jgi:cytochrome c peroxidase